MSGHLTDRDRILIACEIEYALLRSEAQSLIETATGRVVYEGEDIEADDLPALARCRVLPGGRVELVNQRGASLGLYSAEEIEQESMGMVRDALGFWHFTGDRHGRP